MPTRREVVEQLYEQCFPKGEFPRLTHTILWGGTDAEPVELGFPQKRIRVFSRL